MLRSLALACLLSAAVAPSALAQDQGAPPDAARDEEARRIFQSGTSEFDAGRFEQALSLFQQSYEMSHRGALLYNIGLCHDRLRHDREALDAFQGFQTADPTSTHHTEVEARIRALHDVVAREEAEAQARANAQAEHTTVPTPDETAHADAHVAPPVAPPPHDGGNVLGEWWFWTLIGVAVVGGVVATVLLAGATRGTEAPITPPGGVFMALEGP